MAMTVENLFSKADIAAELAHRDIEIESLRKQLATARRDALEEAEKSCDDLQDYCSKKEGHKYPELRTDAITGCGDCSTAVRNLKT